MSESASGEGEPRDKVAAARFNSDVWKRFGSSRNEKCDGQTENQCADPAEPDTCFNCTFSNNQSSINV